jgi:hypothetical protein
VSSTTYYLVALSMGGVLVWQIVSGEALGAWWQGRIFREDRPKTYWFMLAVQCAILIAFLFTGRSWPVR